MGLLYLCIGDEPGSPDLEHLPCLEDESNEACSKLVNTQS